MKVKICGIRRKKDLKSCEKYGTDFIGFINIKRSKRLVEIEEINELVSSMNHKDKSVLVIEPLNIEDAEVKISRSEIGIIQLHCLSPNEIRQIKRNNEVKIIRALGISEEINMKKIIEIENFARASDYLLFDYELNGKTGGTGKQIPIKTSVKAAKIAKNANSEIKLFLAGGMNADRIKKEAKP